MNRYSSSVHKSDWECSSKSVRGSFFVNPLYIKNLTNLTNLTTLQTLQPYRFLCGLHGEGPLIFVRVARRFKLEKWHFPTTEWLVPLGPDPIRNDGLEPCEPSKIKRTHRSRSFWLPCRRSQASLAFTKDADDIPEMLHRGGEGFHGIVVLQDSSHRQARQGSVAFMVPQRQVLVLQVCQLTVELAS